MQILKSILADNQIKSFTTLSQRIFLDGKSYKISLKQNCTNMRFNRVNKTIIVGPYIKLLNKNGQKKLYLLNANLSKTNLSGLLNRIRTANTYTLRGVWSSSGTLTKRAGRISEYM